MSKTIFSSPSDTIEIGGPERHHFAYLIDQLALAVFSPHIHEAKLKEHLPPGSYPLDYSDDGFLGTAFSQHFNLWATAAHDAHFLFNGEEVEIFGVMLNTAYRVGSDPIRLAARIHGQCEIHCFVEGPNRAWMAEIIRAGRQAGIYRDGMNWEALIDFLTGCKDEPVVLSHSSSDEFPIRPDNFEGDSDSWYDLPAEKRWELSLAALRAKEFGHGLEIKPEGWNDFTFGAGVSAFELIH